QVAPRARADDLDAEPVPPTGVEGPVFLRVDDRLLAGLRTFDREAVAVRRLAEREPQGVVGPVGAEGDGAARAALPGPHFDADGVVGPARVAEEQGAHAVALLRQ